MELSRIKLKKFLHFLKKRFFIYFKGELAKPEKEIFLIFQEKYLWSKYNSEGKSLWNKYSSEGKSLWSKYSSELSRKLKGKVRPKIHPWFYGKRALYKVLWCFDRFPRSYGVTKFWIWCEWRHARKCTRHFSLGFVGTFLLILWKNNFLHNFMVV